MKVYIFSFLALFIFISINNSQVNQEWVARYNGPSNMADWARSMTVDSAGNVYVTGQSTYPATGADLATIKYNSLGVQLWAKIYSGYGNFIDDGYAIAVDHSGNVYVTGECLANLTTGSDIITIKYNSSGVQQWVQLYNGPGNSSDGGFSIAVDETGNVYVTGISTGNGTYLDYATIKYNSSGVQQWVQRYDGPGGFEDWGQSIGIDRSGNIYVTGYSKGLGGSNSNYDFATIKYNSSGIQQWVQRYNGPYGWNDEAYMLAIDTAGNVYVTGRSYGTGSSTDYATIKYNSSGVQQWVQRYGPNGGWNQANSIAVDISGNVLVTGACFGTGTELDCTTIKYNSLGVQQWVQSYNGQGNGNDHGYDVAVDGSGNVYVTGDAFGGSGTLINYLTVKYNSSGSQQWVQSYNGPGNDNDRAYGVGVDGSGNVYVAGWSPGSGTNNDIATIKYSPMISIREVSNEVPKSYGLYQNYPNPFNPTTKIKFNIPLANEIGEGQEVRLVVYDLLGREVATLVKENLKPGSYEVDWNVSNFPSGVYLYKLITGDFTATRKMILLK